MIDVTTGTILLLVAFLLFTKPGRGMLLIVAVLLAIATLWGCASTTYAPNQFVCSDPTDVGRCAIERRLYELELDAARRDQAEFFREHSERARRVCEHAHGTGSILCQ